MSGPDRKYSTSAPITIPIPTPTDTDIKLSVTSTPIKLLDIPMRLQSTIPWNGSPKCSFNV